MLFSSAFGIQKGDLAAIVGAGGKTTLMQRLARELTVAGLQVITGTTTKIYPIADPAAVTVLTADFAEWRQKIGRAAAPGSYLVLGRTINQDGKITGLSKDEVNEIYQAGLADVLIMEADGAKGKPFKAPRDDEPVIPEAATVVIAVIGADCLGQPLTEAHFHAWERIGQITGLAYGDTVTPEDAGQVLLHPSGYQKNLPPGARWIPFINKVDNPRRRENALVLMEFLHQAGVARVVWGAAGAESPWAEAIAGYIQPEI